jgi:hypothetical protein
MCGSDSFEEETWFNLPTSKQASAFPHPKQIALPSQVETRAYLVWLRRIIGMSQAEISEHIADTFRVLGESSAAGIPFPSLRFCAFLYFYRLDIPITDIVPENFGTELFWLENHQRISQPHASVLSVPLIPIVPQAEDPNLANTLATPSIFEGSKSPRNESFLRLSGSPRSEQATREPVFLSRADGLWWCRHPSYYTSPSYIASVSQTHHHHHHSALATNYCMLESISTIDQYLTPDYPCAGICHLFQTCKTDHTRVCRNSRS